MDAINKWIFFISINILLIAILRITLPMTSVMLIMAAMNVLMGFTFSVIGTQEINQRGQMVNWYAGLPYFSGILCLAYYLV